MDSIRSFNIKGAAKNGSSKTRKSFRHLSNPKDSTGTVEEKPLEMKMTDMARGLEKADRAAKQKSKMAQYLKTGAIIAGLGALGGFMALTGGASALMLGAAGGAMGFSIGTGLAATADYIRTA